MKSHLGGEAAAKLAFQFDEQGFKESEVDLPSVLSGVGLIRPVWV